MAITAAFGYVVADQRAWLLGGLWLGWLICEGVATWCREKAQA